MKTLLILLLLVPSLSWGGLGWDVFEAAMGGMAGVLGIGLIVFIPIVLYNFLKKIINKSSTNNSSSSVYKTLEKKFDNMALKKDTPEFIPTSQREANQTKPISPQSMALNEEKEKEDVIRERKRRDKEIALKEDKEKKANNSKDYEVEKQKQSQLEKELELINSVYKEKEIEHQEFIQEQNKIKAEENKKLEELKNLNFDELRKKKEEIEKRLNLSNENNN
mgnify:CR=1 FL=1